MSASGPSGPLVSSWNVILRIYYIRSKVSISIYCLIVKKFGFNQNIEIESQHFEFRN